MKTKNQIIMKTTGKMLKVLAISLMMALFFVIAKRASAQNMSKESLSIISIKSNNVKYSSAQLADLARLDLEKLGIYEVMDKYDIISLLEEKKLNPETCLGKSCLINLGKQIGSDKMMTGSVDLYGEKIIITLRLIDIFTESIEKVHVEEFLDLQNELSSMMHITVNKMFSKEIDKELFERLTKKNNYESSINNPDENILKLAGPRMGFTVLTGEASGRFQAPEKQGGFDAFPMMFQFGYQFEKQYINEGNFQALFEFIPMVTGLDQGMFLPSFTILNGLRDNRKGWEFAFGPTLSFVRKAQVYYADNTWQLKEDWSETDDYGYIIENPHKITEKIDSRGSVRAQTGFVFAVGRSFKSGNLNIPLNAYVIPGKDGWRFGLSMGFNGKSKNKQQ